MTSSMTSSVVTPGRDRDVISWRCLMQWSLPAGPWRHQLAARTAASVCSTAGHSQLVRCIGFKGFFEKGVGQKTAKNFRGGPNCQNFGPNEFSGGFYKKTKKENFFCLNQFKGQFWKNKVERNSMQKFYPLCLKNVSLKI